MLERGGSRASGSSGCRSTTGRWSIHGWTPCARVRPSATATPSRRPGRRSRSASGVPAAGRTDRDCWNADASPVGLLKFDLARDEVASWSPGPGRTPSEPLFVRAARRPQRRRGLAADRRRRRQPRRQRPLRPRRLLAGPAPPRGGHPPAGAPAGPQPRGVGARRPLSLSGSAGPDRSGSAIVAVALLGVARRPFTVCMTPALLKDGPRPDTVSRRTEASSRASPSTTGRSRPTRASSWRPSSNSTAQGLAGRRRHLHGGLAGPALRRLGRHGPRMGHGGGQAAVAAQDLRCAVAGKALLRPGEAARRGGQARDRRAAGRTGDPLVGQAGPRAGDGRAQPIRRAGDRASTPVASSASTIGAGL